MSSIFLASRGEWFSEGRLQPGRTSPSLPWALAPEGSELNFLLSSSPDGIPRRNSQHAEPNLFSTPSGRSTIAPRLDSSEYTFDFAECLPGRSRIVPIMNPDFEEEKNGPDFHPISHVLVFVKSYEESRLE